MKWVRIFGGGMHACFAALQMNDSHSGAWIFMYAATAILTWASLGRFLPRFVLIAGSLACFLGAAWTASIEFNNPGCRIGTDVPGPVVCGLWLAWLAWMAPGKTRTA